MRGHELAQRLDAVADAGRFARGDLDPVGCDRECVRLPAFRCVGTECERDDTCAARLTGQRRRVAGGGLERVNECRGLPANPGRGSDPRVRPDRELASLRP